MENTNLMGISPEKFARYRREYAKINPYNLPELRPQRRRIVRSELVASSKSNE